jgi:ComF family protein
MSKTQSSSHKLFVPFAHLINIVLDGLFPIRCIGCGKFDIWVCDSCHTTLPLLTSQHCPICKTHETINGQICPMCKKENANTFDGIFVASYYHDMLLQKMIHLYKYRFIRDLSQPLALLLAQAIQNSTLPTPDIIIPVPLHKRRERWRGFNQSAELANALDLHICLNTDILLRVRYTTPQVQMKNKIGRQENLSNAFVVTDELQIKNKNILLIDDVVTTGTTLHECSRTLKNAGAKSVFCLVLARE